MKNIALWIFLSNVWLVVLFGKTNIETSDLQAKKIDKSTLVDQNEIISLPITEAPTQVAPEEQTSQEKDIEFGKSGCPIEENICDSKEKSPVPQDLLPKASQNPPTINLLKENNNSKKVRFVQEEFYNLTQDETSIIKKNIKKHPKLFLKIKSLKLQAFMGGSVYRGVQQIQTFSLDDSYTQITNIDGKIYEYKYAQKSIDRYSAIATHQKYPLRKISKDYYEIHLEKIPEFFDTKGCKIVVKKELVSILNQKKEVIIDLNTKRELRNKSDFELFLECPK